MTVYMLDLNMNIALVRVGETMYWLPSGLYCRTLITN